MKNLAIGLIFVLLIAACTPEVTDTPPANQPDSPPDEVELDMDVLVGVYTPDETRAAQEIIAIEQGVQNENLAGDAIEFVRSVTETLQFLGCNDEPASGTVSVNYMYQPPGSAQGTEGQLVFTDECGNKDYYCTDNLKMAVTDSVCDGSCFDDVICIDEAQENDYVPPKGDLPQADVPREEAIEAFIQNGVVGGQPLSYEGEVNLSQINKLAACQYWLYQIMDRVAQRDIAAVEIRSSVEGAYQGGGPTGFVIEPTSCSGEIKYHDTSGWNGDQVVRTTRSKHFKYVADYVPQNWNELLEKMEVTPGHHMFLPILMADEVESERYGWDMNWYGPMLYVNDADYSQFGYHGAPWATGPSFHITDAPIDYPHIVDWVKWHTANEFVLNQGATSLRMYPLTEPLDTLAGPPALSKKYSTNPQQYGGINTKNCIDTVMCRSKDAENSDLYEAPPAGCPSTHYTVVKMTCVIAYADGTSETEVSWQGGSYTNFLMLQDRPECRQYEVEQQRCRAGDPRYRHTGGNEGITREGEVGYYCIYSDRQEALSCGAPNVGPYCQPQDPDPGCIGDTSVEIPAADLVADEDYPPNTGSTNSGTQCGMTGCNWKPLDNAEGGQCQCTNTCYGVVQSYPRSNCPDAPSQGGDQGASYPTLEEVQTCTSAQGGIQYCDGTTFKTNGRCIEDQNGAFNFAAGQTKHLDFEGCK